MVSGLGQLCSCAHPKLEAEHTWGTLDILIFIFFLDCFNFRTEVTLFLMLSLADVQGPPNQVLLSLAITGKRIGKYTSNFSVSFVLLKEATLSK